MIKTFFNFFDIRRSPITKFLFWALKSPVVLISLLLTLTTAIWLAGWAFWYEPSSLIVKNHEINIAELPREFNNFKIVAISDIHGGSNFITAEKIRRVVELANAENADLIVLLGDYVSQSWLDHNSLKMPVETVANSLRGLKAKHGVYAIIGNHDLWYDEPRVQTELERVGIKVLNDEAVKIEKDGQNLILLGLPEVLKYGGWQQYSNDGKKALTKLGESNDNIIVVLVHNPDALPMITGNVSISKNLRLILAGHTHGGQVNLPFFGALITPSSYGQKYAQGLIAENGVQMFVTPGIGTSILPVRFRVPPEISLITLNRTQ